LKDIIYSLPFAVTKILNNTILLSLVIFCNCSNCSDDKLYTSDLRNNWPSL